MSRAKPCVTFSLSGKEVSWLGRLIDASNDEIAAFRWDCQWALHSLNVECLRRNSKDAKTAPISDLTKTLEENAVKIKQVGELTGSQQSNLSHSKSFLQNLAPSITEVPHEKRQLRFCKEFCWQVTKQTNWHLTLLLIASFGRKKLGKLKDDEGIEVLRYLHENQITLSDRVRDVLDVKAVALGLQDDDDGCHSRQDASEFQEVDSSSLPQVKIRDLTDPGATSYDWTATTASMKQPGLYPQDTHTVELHHEGDGTQTGQQVSRVISNQKAAVASSTKQPDSNPLSNLSSSHVVAEFLGSGGSAAQSYSESNKAKRPRLNPDDASHTQYPQAPQVIPSFPTNARETGQFRECGTSTTDDEYPQIPTSLTSMSLPRCEPSRNMRGMNGAVLLSQESPQTSFGDYESSTTVVAQRGLFGNLALNHSSGKGNEGMQFQQTEQQDAYDSETWECNWGISFAYPENNAACP